MEVAKKYKVIIADPPWKYVQNKGTERGSAESAMTVMDIWDIRRIPVWQWADEDCFLFLWGTWPHLPDFATLPAFWNFAHITGLPWVKTYPNALFKPVTGIGTWFRGSSELLSVSRASEKAHIPKGYESEIGLLCGEERQLWAAVQRPHSKKPSDIHELIERYFPGPYLELFAREQRPGWDCWGLDLGYELGKFGVRRV